MGDVVSVREKSGPVIYDVDDGSGVVSCVQWRKTRESSEGIYQPGIGQLVSVLGTVDQFRDQRQLKVTAIIPEEDPNAEPCHWLEVEHLWRTVYSTSFTLPPGVTETGDQREVAAKPVKELVEEVLLGHLSSRNSIFTLSTLTGSDEVMGAVWEGVRSETGEGGRGEVERELRAVVKSLPGRGLVVPATDSATFEGQLLVESLKSGSWSTSEGHRDCSTCQLLQ
ncbi:CST complex subunit STN1 [Geodia barretti]|uniref:CST complex subunit STN1 n=1 Tax=Geodia barretti TaxID=519541 RepID=A0AA35SRS1_GEOBA|nr:CST complex subunit STN1 [Geodia barretti]